MADVAGLAVQGRARKHPRLAYGDEQISLYVSSVCERGSRQFVRSYSVLRTLKTCQRQVAANTRTTHDSDMMTCRLGSESQFTGDASETRRLTRVVTGQAKVCQGRRP